MRFIRLLPIAVPVLIFVLLEAIIFYPRAFYFSLIISDLSLVYAVWQFRLKGFAAKTPWKLMLFPAVFLTGLAVYALMISNQPVLHILFLSDSIFLYLYLKNIYYYFLNQKLFQAKILKNIFLYGSFLSFFFMASSIYGLQSFLNLPVPYLVLILLAAALLIIYQSIWDDREPPLLYILIISLVIIEAGWGIFFLPVNYNVAGLALAIFYYILINLTKLDMAGNLSRRFVKIYLLFGFFTIFLILLTARWR